MIQMSFYKISGTTWRVGYVSRDIEKTQAEQNTVNIALARGMWWVENGICDNFLIGGEYLARFLGYLDSLICARALNFQPRFLNNH